MDSLYFVDAASVFSLYFDIGWKAPMQNCAIVTSPVIDGLKALTPLPIGPARSRKSQQSLLPAREVLEDLLRRELHSAEISALRLRNCAATIGIADNTFSRPDSATV